MIYENFIKKSNTGLIMHRYLRIAKSGIGTIVQNGLSNHQNVIIRGGRKICPPTKVTRKN